MMKVHNLMKKIILICLSLMILLSSQIIFLQAQENRPEGALEAQIVRIPAADGLEIVADFYQQTAAAPAVILVHMLGNQRSSYAPLIPLLVDEQHYTVLNIDMRGHGETGGSKDWPAAEQDMQVLFDWLRQQSGVDSTRMAVIGASIGSNIAIIGCGHEPACVTVIALSPGLSYKGVTPEASLADLDERSLFLVAGQADTYSANSVKQFSEISNADLLLRLFNSPSHGTNIFSTDDGPELIHLIAVWLSKEFE